MSQRVLSTDRAKNAARQMNSLLTGGLPAQLAALKQHGQALCSPAVWDGPAAARFRSQQWPPVSLSMDQALRALASLEKSAQTAVDNIIQAGSQGSMGAAITGPATGLTAQNPGDTAANAASAAGGAPPEPFLVQAIGWNRVGGAVSHFLGQAGHDVVHGAETAGADTVNFVASVGNAAVHDPGDLGKLAGGLALTGVSAAGLGVGVAMDATGVGFVAGGAELTAASVAGLAAGTYYAGSGAGAIARDAACPDRVTIMKADSDSASGSGSNPAKTKQEIADQAKELGYDRRIPPQRAPFNSHGQPVYTDGTNYLTPDVDGHNVTDGWKLFDRRGQRVGTYSWDLTRVKG